MFYLKTSESTRFCKPFAKASKPLTLVWRNSHNASIFGYYNMKIVKMGLKVMGSNLNNKAQENIRSDFYETEN